MIENINNPLFNEGDLKDHDAVAVIIKNENNEILLQDHVKHNFWTIPIGKVEDGQSIEDAVRQEMKEELNIEVLRFTNVSSFITKYSRNNRIVTVTEYLFELLEYSGTIINNEPHKHRSIQWMKLEDIKKLDKISNGIKAMFRYYNI